MVEAAASNQKLTWLADGDAYLASPPTIIHIGPLHESLRTLIEATRSELRVRTIHSLGGKSSRERTEAIFLKMVAPLTTDVSRRVIAQFVPNASVSILTGHIRVPEFPILADAIIHELVGWLADAVAADGQVTRQHIEFCQQEIHGWCQTMWSKPPQPDTAGKAMKDMAQMCRRIVWNNDVWSEEGVSGLDPPEPDFEPTPSIELGIARLNQRPTPQRLVGDFGGVGWLARGDVDPRLITTVNREPIRTELMQWAESAPIFDQNVGRDYHEKLDPDCRKQLGETAVLMFCQRVREADETATQRRQAFVDSVINETAKGLLVGNGASVETGQRVFSTWLQLVNPDADPTQFSGAVSRMSSLCEAHHVIHTSRTVTRLEQDNQELKRTTADIRQMLVEARQEQATARREQAIAMADARARHEQECIANRQQQEELRAQVQTLTQKLDSSQSDKTDLKQILQHLQTQNQTVEMPIQRIGDRIEFDPSQEDWYLTADELRTIFEDHPDPKLRAECKRARLLRNIGVPRKRNRNGNGWQCIREI